MKWHKRSRIAGIGGGWLLIDGVPGPPGIGLCAIVTAKIISQALRSALTMNETKLSRGKGGKTVDPDV